MPSTPFQIDYTNKDYEAFRNMMINNIPLYAPEWTDTSESDFGIVLLELLSVGLDILSYYQDRAANEAYLPTAKLRKSVIKLSKLVGYTLAGATPAKAYVVFTLTSPAPANGYPIYAGTMVSTQPTQTTVPVIYETDTTITIPAGKYGNEVDVNGNYLYQVSATHGQTVYNEVLGSSDGVTQSQAYQLKSNPVINDSSLRIYVTNAAGLQQQWNVVTNFLSSQPNDQVYKSELDDNAYANITFGTGSSGSIPNAGTNNISATYRVGGGTIGNVGLGTLTNLMTPLAGIASVTNPAAPYILGTDAEDINHAKQNAPVLFRTNRRAVTLQDFSDLVVQNFSSSLTTPILNAIASNNTATWTYDINLYCLRSDFASLSSADITAIKNYIDTVRLINSKVQILSAGLVVPTLSLTITLQSNYIQSAVKTQVTQALLSYIQTSNFAFGQTLPLSAIMNVVMGVAGVANVTIQTPTSDIIVGSSSIIQTLVSANLSITATGGVVG